MREKLRSGAYWGTYSSTGVSLASVGRGAGRAAAVAPSFVQANSGYVTLPSLPSSAQGGVRREGGERAGRPLWFSGFRVQGLGLGCRVRI